MLSARGPPGRTSAHFGSFVCGQLEALRCCRFEPDRIRNQQILRSSPSAGSSLPSKSRGIVCAHGIRLATTGHGVEQGGESAPEG